MMIGSVANWRWTVFDPAVELIDHFVGQVENQIADAIHNYKTEKKTYVAVYDPPEPNGQQHGQEVERYRNLDSTGWNMKALFEEHFPNLQRRSAFMTVYSFF